MKIKWKNIVAADFVGRQPLIDVAIYRIYCGWSGMECGQEEV